MKTLLLLLLLPLGVCAAGFPEPYNSEREQSAPLPAAEAAARLRLPPGFKATVFAAEPDVQDPIAMAWDTRGRLWIAENYTYAESGKKFDLNLRDRILIFEDVDGDGRFDTRKVFADDLQVLTSIEVGLGGVWVMCPPQLGFIPDRNRDDVPDGPAEVRLDGFTVPPENYHNFANGLRFGPDGWLYGRCGASSPGELGAPGTPANQRIPMRGTIWRYHPRRKVVEALSGGTTNPWGHDWNEHGELFFINTVNGHLWHHFAGARFVRPHTIDPNPRVYALIDQHADHWHFDTAEGWAKSRDGKANDFGGGHAHAGMMIYLGDNWPAENRGRLFTLNMHGRRVNQEILERTGSGYVGRHGRDLIFSEDNWFRGMELSYGPDGGVFVLDWSDAGECHESTGVHRTSGRVFKISFGDPRRSGVGDLAKLDAPGLVALHTHANEWFARQARLELAGRAQAGRALDKATTQLRELFGQHRDVVVKLRALWSLHAIGAAEEPFLRGQLQHPDEHVRAWAVRLLTDAWPLDTAMSQRLAADSGGTSGGAGPGQRPSKQAAIVEDLVQRAKTDSSGLVRLALGSTLQRLPVPERAPLAAALMARDEDARDPNLPLLIWYGLIPVADADLDTLVGLAKECALPTTRKFIARRVAEDLDRNPGPLDSLIQIATTKPAAFQGDILNGMTEAFTGWRKAVKPASWDAFATRAGSSGDAAVREWARDLSVLFGDGRALDEVKKVALDKGAELNARKAALQTLIENRPPGLQALCEQLLSERFLNPVAARGLASFDDPAVGAKLARAYRQFHPSERGQLLSVLVSRPSFARALLDAVAEGKIARADLSVFHARQIRGLGDAALNRKLAETWGELREGSADKRQLMDSWRGRLSADALAKADLSRGRLAFNAACASCHTLYGEGGKAGPDLTGGGRSNLDYLLENILDPSAVVTADFRMSILDLKDGRVLNGVITARTERTLSVMTMTESLTLERAAIDSIQESSLSLMPEGLLEALPPDEARNLIAYLMHSGQVPVPSP
jgi:putative membrane-bound dehydrogenase-like protein